MNTSFFGKVLTFIIVVLFTGMNCVSTVDSITFKKCDSTGVLNWATIGNPCLERQKTPQIKPDGLSSTSCQQIQPGTVTPRPINNRGEVIFSQGYYLPTESWNFYTSASEPAYLAQEDFWGLTSDIGDVEWYGLPLIYNYGWTPGDPTGMTFEIKFFEDNAGSPGAEVASFSDLQPE
ncbi:MAG TPA: hypothetical protein DSN98_03985, partial [Thermoplasmata archaeon]